MDYGRSEAKAYGIGRARRKAGAERVLDDRTQRRSPRRRLAFGPFEQAIVNLDRGLHMGRPYQCPSITATRPSTRTPRGGVNLIETS